jgi:opacity protein-like surface antigen
MRSLPFAVALMVGCGTAAAADWQFDPFIEAGALFNDNYTLVNSASKADVSGGFVDAGIEWRAEAPRSVLTIEPRIRTQKLPDDEDLDSTDYFLDLVGEQRNTRSTFGMRASFRDQDIVQSQLPDTDFGDATLGELTGPDSGRIFGDNRETLLRALPYARFRLSERVDLAVEGRFDDVSYERDIANFQVGYQTLGAAIQLDRQFTPTSRFGLRLDTQQTDLDAGAAGDSDINGAVATWDYRAGERVTAYARAGVRRSEFDLVGVTPAARRAISETTPLFAAGVRWGFLKSQLFIDAKREVDVNSSGFVLERSDLRVYYDHRFTVRVRGWLAAYLIDDDTVTDTALYAARRYTAGTAGLEWRFRQAWSVQGQIGFASQEFGGGSGSADGTSGRVSVQYRPRRRE